MHVFDSISARRAGEWYAGVDVGGTKTEAVIVGRNGVVATHRVPTVPGVAGVVTSAGESVTRAAREAGVADAVSGVGLGAPGVVDGCAGSVAQAVNLGIDAPVPLARLVAEALGVPAVVENDLNVAALGASATLGLNDVAYLSLGTGMAAGLVLDGRLRRGGHGAAGEIGHLPFAGRADRCACGQTGCLEVYGSGRALDRAWPSSGEPAPLALFRAASFGHPRALKVQRQFAEAVAWAVRTLLLTCDVADVVIGGGVSRLGDQLLVPVREVIREWGAASAFIASLGMDRALRVAPDAPLAAIGAATLVGNPDEAQLTEVQ